MSIIKEIEQKMPEWANYKCKDRWGRVWAWSHEPKLETYQGREIWGVQDKPDSRCAMISFGSVPKDWRQTLVKIHENRL